MPTLTTNYSLQKPLVNSAVDQDLWGGELNSDLDSIDTLLKSGITITTQSSQITGFVATVSISVKYLYPCDATSGAFAATLPTAIAAGAGATVYIKKTDSSVNAITVTRASSDTIDGATTYPLSWQNQMAGFVSDGVSKWYLITNPYLGTLTAKNIVIGGGSSPPSFLAPGTAGNAPVSNGTDFVSTPVTILSGSTTATTSGTSIDFTGLPSTLKRIILAFVGVSTNGTSIVQVQLGSGSITATGYLGAGAGAGAGGTVGVVNNNTGFLTAGDGNAAYLRHGSISFVNLGSNLWVASGGLGSSGTATIFWCTGSLALGGTLDRIRLTTVNGIDTFDAGSINILYES